MVFYSCYFGLRFDHDLSSLLITDRRKTGSRQRIRGRLEHNMCPSAPGHLKRQNV